MSKILGISCFYHDSAAALVIDGAPVGAVAEERLSRIKHDSSFPDRAIEFCLNAGCISDINELDAIVFYEKPLLKFQRMIEGFAATWPHSVSSFVSSLPKFLDSKFDVETEIRTRLPGYKGPVYYSEHHLSHAAAGFYTSPFQEAAILTIDGVGEWDTTTIGIGNASGIKILKSIRYPHSIGLLYSALTDYLGFEVNEGEWKVMGLSAYGKPKYLQQFSKLTRRSPDGSFQLDMTYFEHHRSLKKGANESRWAELFGFAKRNPESPLADYHSDLAHSGQLFISEMIVEMAREAKRVSGCENLIMSGGVALNGIANYRIDREKLFTPSWIPMAPGDDGAALGAALLIAHEVFGEQRSYAPTQPYLGPKFNEHEVEAALKSSEIAFSTFGRSELIDEIVSRLVDGKIVALFHGGSEFGPRALGARSILADPRNAKMKNILNDRIKFRETFRPFAPVVTLERAHEFFEVSENGEFLFMSKVVPLREEKRALIPAVCHEDGTARVQTVTESNQPFLYSLLKRFELKTGIPILVNTSFNVRGEPIVCTPQDAINTFRKTEIDALVLESHLADRVSQIEIKTKENPVILKPTDESVLKFYQLMPFNYFSKSSGSALEIMRQNPIRMYKPIDKYLRKHKDNRILDVGCGTGWFINACAYKYGVNGIGIDMNSTALSQARAVARILPQGNRARFIESDLFSFETEQKFSLVNCLGVLHHTEGLPSAIKRISTWVKPGGYLNLGLYHKDGREPFIGFFKQLKDQGKTEDELFLKFKSLLGRGGDELHLRSWFRDQVLHPLETRHGFSEISELLSECDLQVETTSLDGFRHTKLSPTTISRLEEKQRRLGQLALMHNEFNPGFFVVCARKRQD